MARFVPAWPYVLTLGLSLLATSSFDWDRPSTPLVHPWRHTIAMMLLLGIPGTLAFRELYHEIRADVHEMPDGSLFTQWMTLLVISFFMGLCASSSQS